MAGILQRSDKSPRARSVREVLRRWTRRPLGLERLEDRLTPSFNPLGVPFWLENGSFSAAEGGTTAISGVVPNPTSGAVEEVTPHPTNPNILFAAGTNGGVWRTTDALAGYPTWVPLTDQLPSPSIGDLDLNPNNPEQLLAGSGRLSSFAQLGGDLIGALYSENATAADAKFRVVGVGSLDGLNIRTVLARRFTDASGAETGYLLAGGQRWDPSTSGALGNLYRSLDNGRTWLALDLNQDDGSVPTTQLVPGGPGGDLPGDQSGPIGGLGQIFDAAADPGDYRRVYVVGASGVYVTDDITVNRPIWRNISTPNTLNAGNATIQMGFGVAPVTQVAIENAKIAIHHSEVGGVTRNIVYLATTSIATGDLQSISWTDDRGVHWHGLDRPQSLTDEVQIADASFASPVVITTFGAHGLATGDRVYIQGVTGNLIANAVWTVTVTGANTFSLNGSQATGVYTGGGTVAKIFFTHPGQQASIHFSLAADPVNPNLVYIGGDRQERLRTFPNQTGAISFTSNLFRGDRTLLPGQGNFLQSPQWTEITGIGTSNGSSPHADSRSIAFDAMHNLIEGDDGGIYKLSNPSSNTGIWTSLNGNIGLGQFTGVAYDVLNNVVFGGQQDTSVVQQLPSKLAQGSNKWETATLLAGTNIRISGDGGPGRVDNVSLAPTATIRMQMVAIGGFYRETYNANGALTNTDFALFAAPDKVGQPFTGVTNADAGAYPFPGTYELNSLDPRTGLIGVSNLYEDNNPSPVLGGLFDVVAKVTPAGMTGTVSSIVYGGKQIFSTGQKSFQRVAYVGTTSGQVFVRAPADDFIRIDQTIPDTFPAAGILDIAVDPDDWRTAYVVRGEEFGNGAVQSAKIWKTDNAGLTWTDVSGSLFATPQIDPGSGFPYHPLNADGTLQTGMTSEIATLALYDPFPGTKAGGTVLLAGGRGGVFRAAFDSTDPNVVNGKWSELGAGMPNAYVYDLALFSDTPTNPLAPLNRLVVGTQGRGAWSIPDITTIVGPAVLEVIASPTGSVMTLTADPTNPQFVFVNDGAGNEIRLDSAALDGIRFKGGPGADTVIITASGVAGGDLSYIRFPVYVDLGGNDGDGLIIRNAVVDGPVRVTITSTTVGGAPGDTIFSGLNGSRIEYSGLELGTLLLDLGTDAADGNQVFIRSTSALTTRVEGGLLGDEVRMGTNAGIADDGGLDLIGGGVAFDGRGGADLLVVADFSTASSNGSVRIVPGAIVGLAGAADQFPIIYENLDQLQIIGGNGPALAEVFVVESPSSTLTILGSGGPDTLIVRANPLPITFDGGPGDNRLIVDRSTSATGLNATVANNLISGTGGANITFQATGGRFFSPAGDGIRIIGSNTAPDLLAAVGGLVGSQIALEGGGGDDTFVLSASKITGSYLLRGNDGSDRFNINIDGFNIKAAQISVAGGGGGNDVASISGSDTDDDVPTVTVTDPVSASVTGLGGAVLTDHLTTLAFDGRRGHNLLTFVDGTAGGLGSASDPLGGIIYKPTGKASGEFRMANGTIGPIVSFANMNGRDVDGVVVQGTNGDTLAVLLASDIGGSNGGPLAELETTDGSDTVTVSDQLVTATNATVGYLRAVAIGRNASGRPTIGTLVVRTGNEGGTRGDTVTATPSGDVNIVVDGGAPTRRPGDRLTVNTTEPTSLARIGNLTRVSTGSGSGLSFQGFESIDTSGGTSIGGGIGRTGTILAVGADAGGGPRVVIYDAGTRAVLFDRFVYAPTFTGGVRVATGDVTGDGVADVIVGAGYGGGPHVQVFDGVTFRQIANFFAYENTFRGGMYVAAGDLDGDGQAEIVTGVGPGGGPLVKVFDGTGRQLSGFFAYENTFRGGVRVATGDVNGDGAEDIVTGAGPGGGPLVRVFSAGNLVVLDQFFADSPSYVAGVFVAAGDLTGDGAAEVVVGPGGNDRSNVIVRRSGTRDIQSVSVFDVGIIRSPNELPAVSSNVLTATGSDSKEESGIRVATSDFGGVGGKKTIVTARGPGYAPRINFYSLDPPVQQANFLAFEPEFLGGLFVG